MQALLMNIQQFLIILSRFKSLNLGFKSKFYRLYIFAKFFCFRKIFKKKIRSLALVCVDLAFGCLSMKSKEMSLQRRIYNKT